MRLNIPNINEKAEVNDDPLMVKTDKYTPDHPLVLFFLADVRCVDIPSSAIKQVTIQGKLYYILSPQLLNRARTIFDTIFPNIHYTRFESTTISCDLNLPEDMEVGDKSIILAVDLEYVLVNKKS
jgi:hypothetical protein